MDPQRPPSEPQGHDDATARLADFDAANSPEGLMLRYAQGRVAHFLSRQILTLSGTASLILIASPLVGILAMTLALIGEAVDCIVLRRLPAMLKAGADPRRLRRISTATAAFQGLTITACVTVAWFSAPPGQAVFFCIAYLSGAALNAGIVLPFHPPAALVRLGLYGAIAFALYTHDLVVADTLLPRHGYDLMALLIMAYLVYVFVSFVSSTHRRNAQRSREMLVGQSDLADATRRLAERERDARRLSLVARTARDSIFLTDDAGHITWVNEAFTAITGYPADEAIGRAPSDLLNGPDTDAATVARISDRLARGEPVREELLNYTRDGRVIWVETHIVPVTREAEGEALTIAVERDITRAKADARRLARATASAEAANRAKSEFLATMSHEIRTPMNGVMGMADLLAETDLTEDQRLYADTIRSSAQALLTIINDILDLSRLDAGKMSVEPVPTALGPCLRDVATILRPLAQAKGLTLDLDIDPALPAAGVTDAGRLRQILMNLTGNAVKFTERGGVRITARPAMPGGAPGLEIAVADTGIGIAADRLGDVFEAFSQEDGTITRRFGGTGLGLTISRRLARLLGGDISVTSEHGRGSVFTLSIAFPPAELPGEARRDAGEVAAPRGDGPLPRVLVAEDNRTNRLLIARYLKDAPCQLSFAKDGLEAVDAATAERPDLIFMDMSMPGMDGLEATREIRRAGLDPQPVIVALTANAFADDRTACLDAGMNDFLTKPVKKDALLSRIAGLGQRAAAE